MGAKRPQETGRCLERGSGFLCGPGGNRTPDSAMRMPRNATLLQALREQKNDNAYYHFLRAMGLYHRMIQAPMTIPVYTHPKRAYYRHTPSRPDCFTPKRAYYQHTPPRQNIRTFKSVLVPQSEFLCYSLPIFFSIASSLSDILWSSL